MIAAEEALRLLSTEGAALSRSANGSGEIRVLKSGRGVRARKQVCAQTLRLWLSAGVVTETAPGRLVLTDAGRAKARRDAAQSQEAMRAQHHSIGDRTVMEAENIPRQRRGLDPEGELSKLARMRGPGGEAVFGQAEMVAASMLRRAWERGHCGLFRGVDWSAPPSGGGGRVNFDGARAEEIDARRRVTVWLARLTPDARSLIEDCCLRDLGLEAIERRRNWPPRSAKIALKLALQMLAAAISQPLPERTSESP